MPLPTAMMSGVMPRLLMGEEPAEPRDAGLHFVEHQEKAARVAEFPQTLQESGRRNVDADFALDGFDQNRPRSPDPRRAPPRRNRRKGT